MTGILFLKKSLRWIASPWIEIWEWVKLPMTEEKTETIRRIARGSIIAGCAFAIFGRWYSDHWQLSYDPQETHCVDARWMMIDKTDRHPVVGDLFAYRAKNAEPVYRNGSLMGKRIVAKEGDTVTITPAPEWKILVNGKQVAQGMPHLGKVADATARRFSGTRILRSDELWMSGDHPLSFDSRYFGPISVRQLVGRIHVLVKAD